MVYLKPKTKTGKIPVWLGFSAFIYLFIIQGILVALFQDNGNINVVEEDWRVLLKIIPGLVALAIILITGVTSVIAIAKYHDNAILLFLSALFGLMGILFLLGEFLVLH